MPIYDPSRIEYPIVSGHIQVVMENGDLLPAYWSHPARGNKFPGIVLIHDWWGVVDHVRRMAHLFAQTGYYVIVPDLFGGQTAREPQDAMRLVQQLGTSGYTRIHTALGVLERHHQCTADVAAIGFGMGGSFAFEAAIMRNDLEAAVAFGGFPQRYMGQFAAATTPVLAIYGSREPYVQPAAVERLRQELTAASPHHQVDIVPGAGHEFFINPDDPQHRAQGTQAWKATVAFLEKHLTRHRPKTNVKTR